jgi:hypothetical protein
MRGLIALALVLLSTAAGAEEWVIVRKPTDPGQAKNRWRSMIAMGPSTRLTRRITPNGIQPRRINGRTQRSTLSADGNRNSILCLKSSLAEGHR